MPLLRSRAKWTSRSEIWSQNGTTAHPAGSAGQREKKRGISQRSLGGTKALLCDDRGRPRLTYTTDRHENGGQLSRRNVKRNSETMVSAN
jgi:hypothetical protein